MMVIFGLTLIVSGLINSVLSDCKPTGEFHKHYNEALKGHVIKTIQVDRFDCTMKCSEMMGCRSINIYKDGSGKDMCDLNKSTTSKSPDSIVSRAGYEHWEVTARNGCNREDCLGSIDGKIFNSSQFKVFNERLTWGEARKKCRDDGGDLVSIHSQEEQDFISTHILPDVIRGNSSNTRLMMLWRLKDGSDVMLSLKGSASYQTVDGYQALYLDGNSTNYATTPPMDIIRRGFSVGVWLKLLSPLSDGLIYGDWSSPYKFGLKIDKEGRVHFKLMFASLNTTTLSSKKIVNSNVWTHVMASWGSFKKILNIYINGVKDEEKYLNINNAALMFTNHDHDIGLDRNASSALHGYLRDLTVFSWPIINDRDRARMGRWDKRDAVWIGLNDLEIENTFKFSDGSTVSYQNWYDNFPKDTYKYSDCVMIPLENGPDYKWQDDSCGLELPYICRKKIN